MLDTLLKNEFLVMTLDALLHLASVAVLAVIVILACKLLTRGFVDAKLFTGLLIATMLVIVRVFLLNNVGRVLPEANSQLLLIMITCGLFLTAFILVYKLVSIPVLGTALSSTVIIFAQLSLANYVPKLSLKLMPDGQRFAEYAGLANSRTKALMNEAKAYRGQSGGMKQMLADAMEAIKFFTSDTEQEQLSKDFASGIAVYKARKAYMDNMTPEELASYRKAMSEFLSEQGLAENRYSLSNLKNAKPEDLENLATFMKDMNQVYGFTDELPTDGSGQHSPAPPSAESLAQMAQSLSKVEMSGSDMAKLGSLFRDLGIDADSVMASMAQARDDLSDIREVTGRMVGEFKQLVPDELPTRPKTPTTRTRADIIKSDDILISGGYRIKKIPKAPKYDSSLYAGNLEQVTAPEMINDEVSYYIPGATFVIPKDDLTITYSSEGHTLGTRPVDDAEANYFKPHELSPMTTEQSVVLIPNDENEAALWSNVSAAIKIDAWFAASDESGKSTIFIEGNALQDGDIWEHSQAGQTYRFAFEGIEGNLITLIALEKIPPVKTALE